MAHLVTSPGGTSPAASGRRHALVVGAQRSGSTLLRVLLERHPDVAGAVPVRPEPKVFLDDAVLEHGREWYVATYFPHLGGESLLVEKSTTYLERPDAIDRARAVLGEHDAVAILRDPVARAVSNWRFSTEHGFEDRALDRALEECLDAPDAPHDTPEGLSASPRAYLARGRYADLLRPWREAYADRLHVVYLDDLLRGGAAIAALDEALGLRPEPRVSPETVNASTGTPEELPDDLAHRLRDHFAASDAALARLTGRTPPWQEAS